MRRRHRNNSRWRCSQYDIFVITNKNGTGSLRKLKQKLSNKKKKKTKKKTNQTKKKKKQTKIKDKNE